MGQALGVGRGNEMSNQGPKNFWEQLGIAGVALTQAGCAFSFVALIFVLWLIFH